MAHVRAVRDKATGLSARALQKRSRQPAFESQGRYSRTGEQGISQDNQGASVLLGCRPDRRFDLVDTGDLERLKLYTDDESSSFRPSYA